MGLKHLTVGCVHLYDREMRTTKKMVENSRVILDEIYNFLKENEDIVLFTINGDLQHKTPTNKFNRKEVFYWRNKIRQIGELMSTRFKKLKGYQVVGVSDEVKKGLKDGTINPIFTTKGNHDIDNELKYTFYDELLDEGLIVNAKGLLVKTDVGNTFFSFRNYGTENRKIPKFKKPTQVIGLEHNDILHEESSLWKVPNAKEKFLQAQDVVKDTDVVIMHHIHEKIDPLKITQKDGTESILWQVGAIGRTSFTDESKRDVGYGAVMEFGDIENFYPVEFDLIPYKEYFSYAKAVKQKQYDKEYKDFTLGVQDYEIQSTSYKDDILQLDGVEDSVKDYAIQVLDKITANEE